SLCLLNLQIADPCRVDLTVAADPSSPSRVVTDPFFVVSVIQGGLQCSQSAISADLSRPHRFRIIEVEGAEVHLTTLRTSQLRGRTRQLGKPVAKDRRG